MPIALAEIGHAAIDLSSGYGTVASVETLVDGMVTTRMILLRTLIAEVTARAPGSAERAGLVEAYQSLADLQQTHPAEVRALLSYPHVGLWLAHVFSVLDAESDAVPATLWADCGYLGWLAAAGALTCRPEGSVTLVTRNGAVMLPGIGLARLGSSEAAGHCELRWASGTLHFTTDTGTVTVSAVDEESDPAWLPLRTVRGTPEEREVLLDDLDPFRDLRDAHLDPPRLTAAHSDRWQQDFAGAWDLLHRHFNHYLLPMRPCLRALAPLSAQPLAASTSHTAFNGLGCVYTTAPADPCQLALTLIHEIQHAKFTLLTDQIMLFDPDPTCRFYAPWRDDPRPIYGLLHGIYAFFGVTDFWRIHRNAECHRSMQAHVNFALWRVQVEAAIAQAATSGLLTPAGEDFLDRLTASMGAWAAEDVPAATALATAEVSVAHRTFWQVRNSTVSPGGISDLVACWTARAQRPDTLPPVTQVDQQTVPTHHRRLQLAAQLLDTSAADVLSSQEQQPGDRAYLAGDFPEAAALYTQQLRADPLRPQLWAGLALTLPKLYPDDTFSILNDRAAVAAGLYRAIPDSSDIEIVDLLRWLSSEPSRDE
ncbi:HEXXH motif domain-containing protein [Nocardia sp. NPDC049190]|uniref:HEXXH motif domain-containing protein n=1 Tax=Nocardia sp. NPDC049190 TaxID=3155650 RepID=UPI0033F7D240